MGPCAGPRRPPVRGRSQLSDLEQLCRAGKTLRAMALAVVVDGVHLAAHVASERVVRHVRRVFPSVELQGLVVITALQVPRKINPTAPA